MSKLPVLSGKRCIQTVNGQKQYYSSIYLTYDWVNDNGYKNMGDWIEAAAKKAGK